MTSDVTKQVEAFKAKRPIYEGFVNSVESLLANLIVAESVDIVTMESRVKEIASFEEKIQRDGKNYTDPINELTDLAGLRVITHQLAAIDKICTIIRDNFTIDEANSIDKLESLDADRFGYLSVHFVASLNADRAALPEYQAYTGLKVEIQVRTVLQHAWAAIDHKLSYKRKKEIPPNLRRKLYRISALLETADSEFESLRTELEENKKQYETDVANENFDIALDIDSLKAYVKLASIPQNLVQLTTGENCVVMPHVSRRAEYSILLQMLENLKFDNVKQLNDLLASSESSYPDLIKSIHEKWRSSVDDTNLKLVLLTESILKIAVLFARPLDDGNILAPDMLFGEKLRDAVQDTYKEWKSSPEFELPQKRIFAA